MFCNHDNDFLLSSSSDDDFPTKLVSSFKMGGYSIKLSSQLFVAGEEIFPSTKYKLYVLLICLFWFPIHFSSFSSSTLSLFHSLPFLFASFSVIVAQP
jgi:hypothetical protein